MSRGASGNFQTRFILDDRTLLIDLGSRRRVLSSAPRGGGLARARYIVNHQVQANPIAAPLPKARRDWEDPARYLGRVAARHGADAYCVGLMTAVPLRQLVTLREEAAGVWVEGFFTVGVSNAVKAGEPIRSHTTHDTPVAPGTINIILVTNLSLASSAMVGVIQVATESKTAVMISHRIRSWTGRPHATGTGTDTVVVASGEGPSLRYSGTHTAFGAMVGRLVARGVAAGLTMSKRWSRDRATRSVKSGQL